MRAAYAERQDALLRAGERTALGAHLAMARVDAGMHLVGWLRDAPDDRAAARRADAARVFVRPISRFVHGTPRPPGLMLGFAGWRPAAIRSAAERLARALGADR
jgi:GntR family transcriptional regulator/MocR family aminotransferase